MEWNGDAKSGTTKEQKFIFVDTYATLGRINRSAFQFF